MRKQFMSTSAGSLAYVEEGEGSAVILIHGIPTSSYLWRGVVPLLARDFKVYAVDLLGYGDSDKPALADLSVAGQAGHLRAFMDAVDWRRGAVVGHDIGGGVAQLLAVRDPGAVSSLVLCDTIAYDSWPVPDIERLKDPAWDQIMETLDLSKGFRKALEQGMVHREAVDDRLVSEYVRPFRDLEGRRAYLRCARALRTEDLLSVMDGVERLDVPTLIVWGEADVFQKLEFGRRLKERMRRADLVVIPGAGHFVPEDRPEEVARVIRDHLLQSVS